MGLTEDPIAALSTFYKILSDMDVVWGPTNQWFKYFGKYLSHSISD